MICSSPLLSSIKHCFRLILRTLFTPQNDTPCRNVAKGTYVRPCCCCCHVSYVNNVNNTCLHEICGCQISSQLLQLHTRNVNKKSINKSISCFVICLQSSEFIGLPFHYSNIFLYTNLWFSIFYVPYAIISRV